MSYCPFIFYRESFFPEIIILICSALQLECEMLLDFTTNCCLVVEGLKTDVFFLTSFWEINP